LATSYLSPWQISAEITNMTLPAAVQVVNGPASPVFEVQ
jgi:hypothetical protein